MTMARRTVSLDGDWAFLIDPYDTGWTDLFGNRNPKGWQQDFRPRDERDRVEYSFDLADTLRVPGDWNTQRPELLWYEGVLWYRRRVRWAAAPATRQFVDFGAVNHTADVFVNGDHVGHHEGGYGPFSVEVTGSLVAGDNSVVVRVDATRRPDAVPTLDSDWWNYGGIHRSVTLREVPETFLADAWVQLDPSGERLVGEVRVDGPDAVGRTVAIAIGAGVGFELVTGDDGAAAVDRPAPAPDELPRWHPGAPVLHDVGWRLGDDDALSDRVGFRTVRTQGSTVLVNDEPTFLRGISIHAEAPTEPRRSAGPDDARTLVGWAADLGCNFVRLAHYQHDEAMARACDEAGVLAWCEVPVYWSIDFGNTATQANARQQVTELVTAQRNRASVVLWSVANETLPGEDRNAFLADLAGLARRLDPTRLVTAALFCLPAADGQQHLDDPIGEHLDVLGCNNYYGWYYGRHETFPDDVAWTSAYDKPLIMTEFGAGAKAGHHGADTERWTEEFQVAVYEAQFAMQERIGFLAGTSPWILKDFRTPKRALPGIQDGFNRKGLVSERGQRKLAWDTVADTYRRWADDPPGAG